MWYDNSAIMVLYWLLGVKGMSNELVRITTRFPKEIYERMTSLANVERRNVNAFIVHAIEDYLKRNYKKNTLGFIYEDSNEYIASEHSDSIDLSEMTEKDKEILNFLLRNIKAKPTK